MIYKFFVNHGMIHNVMKTATVRDLRTHFPIVEGWLSEGESVVITKSGKRIAVLTKAKRVHPKSVRLTFAKRFGTPTKRIDKQTNLLQMVLDNRGE